MELYVNSSFNNKITIQFKKLRRHILILASPIVPCTHCIFYNQHLLFRLRPVTRLLHSCPEYNHIHDFTAGYQSLERFSFTSILQQRRQQQLIIRLCVIWSIQHLQLTLSTEANLLLSLFALKIITFHIRYVHM